MKQLESLDSWRVSRGLAIAAYRVTLRRPLVAHRALADQIRRAAVSIPANVAEGYALGTKPQLIRAVRIALASAAELRTHLDIAHALGVVSREDGESLLAECARVVALLVGFLKCLGAKLPA